jgi:hypothetical protein
MDVTDTFHIKRMLDDIEDIITSAEQADDLWTDARLAAERKGMLLFANIVRSASNWHMDRRGRLVHNTHTSLVFDPVDTMRSALEDEDEHLVLRLKQEHLCVVAERLFDNVPMSDHMASMVMLGEAGFPMNRTPSTLAGIFTSSELLAPIQDDALDIEDRCHAADMLGQLIDGASEEWTWFRRVVKTLGNGIRNLEYPGPLLHHLLRCSTLRSNWMAETVHGHEASASHLLDVAEMAAVAVDGGLSHHRQFADQFCQRLIALPEEKANESLALLSELEHTAEWNLYGFVKAVQRCHAHAQRDEDEGRDGVDDLFGPYAEEDDHWDDWGPVEERHLHPAAALAAYAGIHALNEEADDIMDF